VAGFGSSRSTVSASSGGSYLWFGRDSNLNVRALFRLHIGAMFVGSCIFKAEISIAPASPVNGNPGLFSCSDVETG